MENFIRTYMVAALYNYSALANNFKEAVHMNVQLYGYVRYTL